MSFSPDCGDGARDATVLVKLSSRLRAESMNLFTFSSAAATWPCKNSLVFPICTARRSVGVGDFSFGVIRVGSEDGTEGLGGAGVLSKSS